MAQHDMNIANQGFPAFRSDLNDALSALVSNSSGATAPTTTFAHQFWLDTSVTPNVLKQRNADNDAWIEVGEVDQTADTFKAKSVVGGVYDTGDQTIAGTKTFSSAPVVPGLNGSQLAGMRNKIINGKMEIAQRGTSFPAIAASYSLDRWCGFNSGTSAVLTASQQTDVPSGAEFQNSLRYAVTTADATIAAGDVYGIRQIIEGYNVRDLLGRTFTLSFWVRSSKTGIHCVAFKNDVDRSYIAEYTINAANTWEQKSITVTGGLITAGTWNWTNGKGLVVGWALASGSTFQTTANTWQTGNFVATANQVNCLDTIGNIFAITGVQLEVGSVATPFEHRPYGTELALCQRYYYRITSETTHTRLAIGFNAATFSSRNIVYFKTQMRTRPTALETTGVAADYAVNHGTTTTTCSAVPAFNDSTADSASVAGQVTSGLTAGGGSALSAVSGAYLAWSAEL